MNHNLAPSAHDIEADAVPQPPIREAPAPRMESWPVAPEHTQIMPDLHDRQKQSADEFGELSLRKTIEIDWDAADRLAAPAGPRIYAGISRIRRYGEFSPSVASALLQRYEPETEVIAPTAEQIKEQSWALRAVSGFLGFFSSKWAERFDRYLERKARGRIRSVAGQAADMIDLIGSIPAPKAQFLGEVQSAYHVLQQAKSPEDLLPQLLERIANTGHAQQTKEKDEDGRKQYPVLYRLLPFTRRAAVGIDNKRTIRAAAPELAQGIKQFLEKQGKEVGTVQFAPFRSRTRRIIQRFAGKRLEGLPAQIEAALTDIYGVLPENGHKFTKSVQAVCKGVVHLSRAGHDGRKITDALLKDLWK